MLPPHRSVGYLHGYAASDREAGGMLRGPGNQIPVERRILIDDDEPAGFRFDGSHDRPAPATRMRGDRVADKHGVILGDRRSLRANAASCSGSP